MEDKLQRLVEVGKEIARQNDYAKLFCYVIEECVGLLKAEGGTLYLYDKDKHCLVAVVAENHVLGMHHAITEFEPNHIQGLFSVPLREDKTTAPERSISGECWRSHQTIVIADTAKEDFFDLTAMMRFDNEHNYKSRSIVAMPLLSRDDEVLGVVQLVNPTVSLDASMTEFALTDTLVRFMGLALENNLLLLASENLLKSVVEMVSSAIDAKSKSTGGHCARVTELTLMLAEAMAESTDGPYADFTLNEDEHNELRIAALLHDVGKIATPNHVMDKSHKLEKVFDKIDYVRVRYLLRQENLRVAQLEDLLAKHNIDIPPPENEDTDADLEFLASVNVGGEFLDEETLERLEEIAARKTSAGDLIEDHDLTDLKIKRGTLNAEERQIMQDHASISISLLGKLPWPPLLAEVPEIAGKHHENCDGSGYPNGIVGEDMSLRAKILSLTDRFEGLSAPDRNYRKQKTYAQIMRIMDDMSSKNQIDPELYQFFKDSGVLDAYTRKFLSHLLEEQEAENDIKVAQAS